MKISSNSWKSYIKNLSKIDKKAAETVSNYYREHPDLSVEQLISYCLAVSDYYGSAAGELACEMYEEVAAASGRLVPTPEPAPTATYGEMAKTVQGVLAQSQNPDAVGAAVGRKVKTVGLDTILKNSLRDGAQFAWIPSGDTCAFCMMLASNGWQRASKKALKNGHASHVHNNCDCSYVVRFDDNTEVEGYDPDYYKDIYDNAEGDTWEQKTNYLRRKNYAANKDRINTQKRLNYANKMRSENRIVWPKSGEKLSVQSFKELREYAESKGVEIRGLKDSTIDRDLAKDVIDRTSDLLNKYNLADKLDYPFTVDFSHALRSVDFAENYKNTHHVIYFNKDAYKSAAALEREYNILVEDGFFVKGTTYSAVAYHEMGHIVGDVYNIDSLQISKKILKEHSNAEALEKIKQRLSRYGGSANGDEIIAECFAAFYSGTNNEFALKFMEECDKIIKQRRQ